MKYVVKIFYNEEFIGDLSLTKDMFVKVILPLLNIFKDPFTLKLYADDGDNNA